jgi:hypothetical protein
MHQQCHQHQRPANGPGQHSSSTLRGAGPSYGTVVKPVQLYLYTC